MGLVLLNMIKSIFNSAMTLCLAYASDISPMGNSIDPSTYGNIDVARTFHLSLDLIIDFPNKRFQGVATHQIDSVGSYLPDAVWFDSTGIDIHGVETAKVGETNWEETPYIISTPNEKLGQAVEVNITSFMIHHPYATDL